MPVETRTIKLDPHGVEDATVETSNVDLLSNEFDPSSILVQILHRPLDPINETLQESLYSWVAAGIAVQPLKDRFGGWIDTARNWQANLFLKAKTFKFQLIIDADVGVPVNMPLLLSRHDKPVVSAVVPCFTKEKGLFVNIAMKGQDGKARFPSLKHTKTLPAKGTAEVHNAGTGCLLVRRDVLEALWEKFENEQEMKAQAINGVMQYLEGDTEPDEATKAAVWSFIRNCNHVNDLSGPPFCIPQSLRNKAAETGVMPRGEDICFTDRVRAAGFSIYADFEARCTHDKTMTLGWPDEAISDDLDPEDWRLTAFNGGP